MPRWVCVLEYFVPMMLPRLHPPAHCSKPAPLPLLTLLCSPIAGRLPQIPRFAFEKFPGSQPVLTTQMKSVGEAMAIGRTFQVRGQECVCTAVLLVLCICRVFAVC